MRAPLTVAVDCPVCELRLPDLPVAMTAGPSKWKSPSLSIEVEADLTVVWWAQVRLSHPSCVGERDDLPTEQAA